MMLPKETVCPYCHIKFDDQTCVSQEEDIKPKAGDVTMCIKCGELAQFTDDGLIPLPEEIVDALNPRDVQIAAQIRASFIDMTGKYKNDA